MNDHSGFKALGNINMDSNELENLAGLLGSLITPWNDEGLVLYLGLDENTGTNASDKSYHGNDGTFTAAGSPAWSEGHKNCGVLFDGADDVIACGNDASILPDAWSIEAWVQPDDQALQPLIAFNASLNASINLHWVSTGRPIIYMAAGNYMYFNGGAWTTLKDGNWHHVVFTCPGAAQADLANSKMFVDGVEIAQHSGVATAPQTAKTLCKLGNSSASYWYKGKMDEVRIYNRVLSANEIKSHYLRS